MVLIRDLFGAVGLTINKKKSQLEPLQEIRSVLGISLINSYHEDISPHGENAKNSTGGITPVERQQYQSVSWLPLLG